MCDGAQALTPVQYQELVEQVAKIREVVSNVQQPVFA